MMEIYEIPRDPPVAACLKHLGGLRKLRALDLRNTRVDDRGRPRLYPLAKPGLLQLYGSKVADAGVAKLRAAMPGVEVR